MNIKKLLIIASITTQFSNIIQAFSQDAYNAAFHAFDVKFNSPAANTNTYKQSADFIIAHGDAYSIQDCSKISNSLNTPEAKAVGIYLAHGTIQQTKSYFQTADGLVGNNMSYANLYAAIAAAPNTIPPVNPTSQQGSTSTPQLSDAVNVPANWTTAFAAFGGAQGVYDKTAIQKTMPASLTATSAAYKDAQVIVQYLGTAGTGKGDDSGVLNTVDKANLQAAFTAANVSRVSSNPSVQLTAKQTNGVALQQAIEDAKNTFNQLRPGTYTATAIIPAAQLPA